LRPIPSVARIPIAILLLGIEFKMRTSVSLALIMIVISELIASSNGLGYFILHAQRTSNVPAVYSALFLPGLFGYVLNALFLQLEGFSGWHRGYAAKRL